MKVARWAGMLVAVVLLIPFAVSNREPVSLGLWPLPFLVGLPLYLLVLLLLLIGFIIGAAAGWLGGRHARRELRRRRRRVEALERELVAARPQPDGRAGKGLPA